VKSEDSKGQKADSAAAGPYQRRSAEGAFTSSGRKETHVRVIVWGRITFDGMSPFMGSKVQGPKVQGPPKICFFGFCDMQPDLTAKQEQFLVYLQKQIERTGGAPSLRKAASDLKISHAAVAQFVRILEKKGILKRDGRYSRDIYLLDKRGFKAASQRGRKVPVLEIKGTNKRDRRIILLHKGAFTCWGSHLNTSSNRELTQASLKWSR